MKEILGQLSLDLVFSIGEEDFKELVENSEFKIAEYHEEGEFLARYRAKLPFETKMMPDIVTLGPGSTSILIYSTPDKLVTFLRKLPAFTEDDYYRRWTTGGVIAYTYRIENLALDGSILRVSRTRKPASQLTGLIQVIGQELIEAGYDLYTVDLDRRNWFHLTIAPAPNRAHKTSVRLIITKTLLEDMVEAIQKVPEMIHAIERDVLGS